MQTTIQQRVRRRLAAALGLTASILSVSAAQVDSPGWVKAEVWEGIPGTAASALFEDPTYAEPPDRVLYVNGLNWPDLGVDNYGVRITGYITVPSSGDYNFFTRSDDASQFYLNTSGAAAPEADGGSYIAEETGCCAAFQEPDTGDAATTQAPVTLQAGQKYGFTFVVKEGGGGDMGQVAMRKVGDTTPAASLTPIGGAFVGTMAEATGSSVVISTPPQSVSVAENDRLNLTVAVTGTSAATTRGGAVAYQWYRGNVAIQGATASNYSVALASPANAGVYKVTASVPGASQTSGEATVTVTTDVTKPTIVSARGNSALNAVTVNFSEPVDPVSAAVAANYSLSPSIAVSSVTVLSPTSVRLNTGAQTQNTPYTLTVTNVKDASTAGNAVAANTTSTFTAWTQSSGFVTAEFFRGIGSVDLQALLDSAKFQNNAPDEIRYLGSVSTPSGYGDDYGIRVTGVLVPPQSGDYHFFVRADDQAAFFINTAGAALPDTSDLTTAVAIENSGCCQAFLEPEIGTETTAAPITLQAGQKYGIVFLMKEGGGGDFAQLAWRREGDTTAAAALLPMAGDLFETLVDPTGAQIDITASPSSVTAQEDRTATFTAAVTTGASVSYQWLRNGVAIPGATSLSYMTPTLSLADNNATYTFRVRVPGLEKTTEAATLTVVPDTFAPVLLSGGALRNGADWDVTLLFDEKLATGGAVVGNYTIPGVTVTSATIVTNSSGFDSPESAVVLRTSALTPGQSYTVSVTGVGDAKGNVATQAQSVPFTASTMSWVQIGRDNDWSDPAAIAVGTNGFNLISGGQSFWGSQDDITFVYEEITGDFDKVARVVDQDPSSQWARAGLHAREVLNGPDYDIAEASRYQNAHVNPTIMFTGTAANNSYEGNRRVNTGGDTTGATGLTGAPPVNYPTAWVRLRREGEVLTLGGSRDGVTWIDYARTDFAAASTDGVPLAAKMYVGLIYGPEAGNVTEESGKRAAWAAVFRDYGNFQAPVANGPLTISQNNGQVTIAWTGAGTLEAATQLNADGSGNWAAVTGVTGTSYTTAADGRARFFRVRR